jgi:prepilin-type N-terminal cleavage/methylation domain-containing protein
MSVPRAGDSRGFTLPELAVVISLIGLLASLALLNVEQVWTRTRASATVTQLAYMREALLNLAAGCDGLPSTASGGGDPGLTYAPSGMGGCWHGPYMSRWPDSTPFNVGEYRYEGRAGAPALVQVTGLPDDAAAAVASQIAAMSGTGASMTAGAGGWTLSLVIGEWYYNAAAGSTGSSTGAAATGGSAGTASPTTTPAAGGTPSAGGSTSGSTGGSTPADTSAADDSSGGKDKESKGKGLAKGKDK